MNNPLDQFKIVNIIPINVMGIDLSFSNSSLMLCISTLITCLFLLLSTRKKALIPGFWQSLVEIIYLNLEELLDQAVGKANSKKYIPFICSIFMFVLMCNLLGVIPNTLATTSHIAVTLCLATIVFVTVTIIGFYQHGLKYFSLFLPHGIPIFIAPLMIVIELFSYLASPFSLAIRLAANITAGHIMLKIVASLVLMAGATSAFLGTIPFALLTILVGFEIFVALLQTYIFAVLTCAYLSDAVNLH